MSTDFHSYFRNLTRDMFIFSAFTGMAYSDIKKLTVKELVTTDDGNLWIVSARKKTGTSNAYIKTHDTGTVYEFLPSSQKFVEVKSLVVR